MWVGCTIRNAIHVIYSASSLGEDSDATLLMWTNSYKALSMISSEEAAAGVDVKLELLSIVSTPWLAFSGDSLHNSLIRCFCPLGPPSSHPVLKYLTAKNFKGVASSAVITIRITLLASRRIKKCVGVL